MPSLPLFPLGSPLLPGARLPLQLFEPRYLALAQTLAEREDDDRRFGCTTVPPGLSTSAIASTRASQPMSQRACAASGPTS